MLDYIADNYDFFLNYSRKLVKGDGADLLHDCMLMVNQDRMLDANNPKTYCCQVLKLTAYSRTSKWRKEREKWGDNEVPDLPVTEFLECNERMLQRAQIDILLDKVDSFDRMVYLAGAQTKMGFKTLSDETKIPLRTLYHSFNKTKQFLIDNLKE